jgi:acetyltransferase-like isoleucine patch superfamily enzyme
MGLLASLRYQARLRWLRRDEYESQPLRDWFARDFGVEVGLYSYGCFDRWRFPARTRIGRYCSFAKTVRVVEANHPLDALTTHPFLYDPSFGIVDTHSPAPPWLEISDDVWVGHNATILAGCKAIGRGAVIAAGAVVTRNVGAYEIVSGLPAKRLKMRFSPDMIEALEASRWWELDRAGLKRLGRDQPDILLHPTVEGLQRLQGSQHRPDRTETPAGARQGVMADQSGGQSA